MKECIEMLDAKQKSFIGLCNLSKRFDDCPNDIEFYKKEISSIKKVISILEKHNKRCEEFFK